MSFNRRDFLHFSSGFCLASLLPTVLTPAAGAEGSKEEGNKEEVRKKETEKNALNIIPIRIHAGAEKTFQALHVSDSHLCFADERENERKRQLAENRLRYFRDGEKYLDAAVQHAKSHGELFLHTGDLIDFVSEQNLEAAQEKFRNTFSFVSSGNHEFSQYVGEAKEDDAYKAQSFARVQKAFPNDLTFCSQVVNGVNFVAFDDVYYNVTAEQLQKFQQEVARGLPIVALCHCPLYTPELFDVMMKNHPGAGCAYLTGVPEERMNSYSQSRREQQKPDVPTTEFLAWLKEQKLVKAVLAGHLHEFWSGPFSDTAMQYVVGGNYRGDAYEITFT